MRRIFLVPKALLASAPIGNCDATGINDTQALLAIKEDGFQNAPPGWDDWFVAQPGVFEFFAWDQLKPAPPELLDAVAKSTVPFTSTQATTIATLRDAIRAIHPLVRWF